MRMPFRFLALVLVTGMAGTTSVLADPPSRVGRISAIEGALSIHTDAQPDWQPAVLNYPVVAGNTLWSANGSRTEIQVGPLEVRLDEQSEIDFLRLDEAGTIIRIDQGTANLHLNLVPPGGVQILTAAGQIDLVTPGRFRVDAGRPGITPPGVLSVATFDGEARFAGTPGAAQILPGQSIVIDSNRPAISFLPARTTGFDIWSINRERQQMAAQSVQFVSPEMTGYQDLDRYGNWTISDDYGALWVPSGLRPDWAPYRYGRWSYVNPWGWTWIDDSPWGFAPFHYGRWVEWQGRWAWCPGRVIERPVYAPALVAFVGEVGRDRPPASWVPLAPREVFRPYYPASDVYIRTVNITHIHEVNIQAPPPGPDNFVNRRAISSGPAVFGGPNGNGPAGRPGPMQPQPTMPAPAPAQPFVPHVEPAVGHMPPSSMPAQQPQPIAQPQPVQPQPAPPQPAMQPRPAMQPQPIAQPIAQPQPVQPQPVSQPAMQPRPPMQAPQPVQPAALAPQPHPQMPQMQAPQPVQSMTRPPQDQPPHAEQPARREPPSRDGEHPGHPETINYNQR